MKYMESRHHYVYTFCIIVEGDFQDGDMYRNSHTMRMCLPRLFTYDGYPSGLPNALEHFLDKEKNTVQIKKGSNRANIQVVNIQIIDQNKIPFTKEENEVIDGEIEEELKKLGIYDFKPAP